MEYVERHVKGVVDEEPPDERLADAKEELQGLRRLEHAHDAWHHAEEPGHRCELWRGRGRVEAAVARTLRWPADGELTLETQDARVDEAVSVRPSNPACS